MNTSKDENNSELSDLIERVREGKTSTSESVQILSKAMSDSSGKIRSHAERVLLHFGRKLSSDEAQNLEEGLSDSEDEFTARSLLLGHYFRESIRLPKVRTVRNKHLFWILENHPHSKTAGSPYAHLSKILDSDSYETGKKLWLQKIEEFNNDTTILGNAASYFLLEDREFAEELLKQAAELEPENPDWAHQLGQLYKLNVMSTEGRDKRATAAQSLGEFEKLLSMPSLGIFDDVEIEDEQLSNLTNFFLLPDLAKTAFGAGEFEQARNYASQLLSLAEKVNDSELGSYQRDGNAIHHGNLILGRLALQDGDIEQAKEYLLKAGASTGSPQLGSFGPNMALAKELLEAGETEIVLDYFEQCVTFWKMGEERLKSWTQQIREGEVPKFGANLVY